MKNVNLFERYRPSIDMIKKYGSLGNIKGTISIRLKWLKIILDWLIFQDIKNQGEE